MARTRPSIAAHDSLDGTPTRTWQRRKRLLGDRMVRVSIIHVLVAVVFARLAQASYAAEVPCPSTIAVNDSVVGEPPTGWIARKGTTTKSLTGISIYDGNPDLDLSVAPTMDRRIAGGRLASWVIPPKSSTWMVCRYLGTSVTLTKELDSAFRTCSLRYGPGGVVQSFQCE